MAIKISNTTVIDDSRNLVNTGISSVLVNSLTSTDTSKALTAAQGKVLQDSTVKLTGNQTIAGVKTFSSSPVAPTPATATNNTSVATTAFVRAAISSYAPSVTTSAVLSAYAGASAEGVGTYVLARIASGSGLIEYGDVVAASLLDGATDVRGVAIRGSITSGSWRCMGTANRGATMVEERTTIWLRIS